MHIHPSTVGFVFGFLASIGLGWVGLKLILAAARDEERDRVARELLGVQDAIAKAAGR